jgi:hypothetical protein
VTTTYTYPGAVASSYDWAVTSGNVIAGQGSAAVEGVWNTLSQAFIYVVETNELNCIGDTVALEVNVQPTDVREINPSEILVYPNPAADYVHLQSSAGNIHRVTLYNSIGQPVLRASNTNTICVEALPCGLYSLHLELATGSAIVGLEILR